MNNDQHWHAGSCHCGSVRFRVRLTSDKAIACNCSICAKKGMINVIVAAEDFELLAGADMLADYQFNTETAHHRFCQRCGIHPFSRPRSHPDGYDVNARCFDAGFDFLTVEEFDGQNWEVSVESIRGKALET